MRQLGYVETFFRTLVYPCLKSYDQEEMVKRRLQKLVKYVKAQSPYYAQLYRFIGDDFKLTDLPVVTKQMLMDNFTGALTDPSLSLGEIHAFMADKDNIGRRIHNKYMVSETSGSTGYPALILHDTSIQNVEMFITFMRIIGLRFPLCTLCVDDGFAVSNGSVRQNLRQYPFIKKSVGVINANRPMKQIIEELNALSPGC